MYSKGLVTLSENESESGSETSRRSPSESELEIESERGWPLGLHRDLGFGLGLSTLCFLGFFSSRSRSQSRFFDSRKNRDFFALDKMVTNFNFSSLKIRKSKNFSPAAPIGTATF